MPELPEVETVRRGLLSGVCNREVSAIFLRRPDLRFPLPTSLKSLVGQTFVTVRRRAKYLLVDIDDGSVMLIHLGMSGRWTIIPPGDAGQAVALPRTTNGGQKSAYGALTGFGGKHDHVEIQFRDGTIMIYTDPRRFGFIDHFPRHTEHAHPRLKILGPEPLVDWSPRQLAKDLRHRKKAIKLALLDQSIVVGVGNIYACEALFRAGISPLTDASTLVRKNGQPTTRLSRLVDAIKAVLSDAIAAGGSSLNDFSHTDGTLGYFSHQFGVYDREGSRCSKPNCKDKVRRFTQQNRSTFHCEKCQT